MAMVKRLISVNKFQKNEELRRNKVKFLISKYGAEITDDLKHNVLIVGDSKVCHLELEMRANPTLTNYWRKGAEVDSTVYTAYTQAY